MHQPLISIPAGRAAEGAPQLAAGLAALHRSQALWRLAQECTPALQTLRVTPSTLQAQTWCLLVGSAADAAKLRQHSPTLVQCAQTSLGHPVELRIKVSSAN